MLVRGKLNTAIYGQSQTNVKLQFYNINVSEISQCLNLKKYDIFVIHYFVFVFLCLKAPLTLKNNSCFNKKLMVIV